MRLQYDAVRIVDELSDDAGAPDSIHPHRRLRLAEQVRFSCAGGMLLMRPLKLIEPPDSELPYEYPWRHCEQPTRLRV
jgi:hypothetical protein